MSYSKAILSFALLTMMITAIMVTLSYHSNVISVIPTHEMPDGFMEDVNALIIDKQGNPSMKIETPRMLHFTKQDTSELIDPRLTIYRQTPEPWHISANFARAQDGIHRVVFWDDVIMKHAADTKNPDTLIRTPKLSFYPLEQRAETDAFITLSQPNMLIRATGMKADMEAGSVKLLKEARGEYVPDA